VYADVSRSRDENHRDSVNDLARKSNISPASADNGRTRERSSSAASSRSDTRSSFRKQSPHGDPYIENRDPNRTSNSGTRHFRSSSRSSVGSTTAHEAGNGVKSRERSLLRGNEYSIKAKSNRKQSPGKTGSRSSGPSSIASSRAPSPAQVIQISEPIPKSLKLYLDTDISGTSMRSQDAPKRPDVSSITAPAELEIPGLSSSQINLRLSEASTAEQSGRMPFILFQSDVNNGF
jgi:hypothetical protein